MIRRAVFFEILMLACLFGACGNEAPANHDAALPHNKMTQADELSEAESQALMAARGKSALLVALPELERVIHADTARVVLVNFWKRECQPCLDQQLFLQNLQTNEGGAGKVSVLSVNLDPESKAERVNLALRKAGVTSPVYQLSGSYNLPQSGMVENWDGNLPALSVFSKGELQAFYPQHFSENELTALLQPFLL